MVQQSGASESCKKDFIPLRQEAERRGKLIKAASARHAPPDEACKLITNFSQAETAMIKYIETDGTGCAISEQVAIQLKNGHKATEALQKKVCDLALPAQRGAPAGPTGDFEKPPKTPIETPTETPAPGHPPGRS